MVNLELYRIFIIVAQNKSITGASKELNISQPAVTKHIKNLEDIIKIKLFIRRNNGVELTKEGLGLYNEIKEAINLLINVENNYSLSRVINLGSHSTMLNKLFSDCLAKFYEDNEDNKVSIVSNDIKDMILRLENKEIDIVLSKKVECDYNKDKITYLKLGVLSDVLIAKSDSKLANETVSIDQLKNQVLYMPRATSTTTTNFFNSTNCEVKDFKNIKNITYNTMIQIIKSTDGIGLVTKEYVENEIIENNLKILNTNFKIKEIEFGVYLNNDNNFKELNKLIRIIREKFKK